MNKRDMFAELSEGFEALRVEREGRKTLESAGLMAEHASGDAPSEAEGGSSAHRE